MMGWDAEDEIMENAILARITSETEELRKMVENIKAERDAAYRAIALADVSYWSPIVKDIWQRDHYAAIKAARKMGDE